MDMQHERKIDEYRKRFLIGAAVVGGVALTGVYLSPSSTSPVSPVPIRLAVDCRHQPLTAAGDLSNPIEREISVAAPGGSATMYSRSGRIGPISTELHAYAPGATIADVGPEALLVAGVPEPNDPSEYYDSGDTLTLICRSAFQASETPTIN